MNQATQPHNHAVIIEAGIPIPNGRGRHRSPERRSAARLNIGECITVVAKDEAEQKKLAKRINSMRVALIAEHAGRDYTVRSMWGEVNGEIHPVVRMWRTQ